MDTIAFHKKFDKISKELIEQAREPLLEGPGTCSKEEIFGQILINNLTDETLASADYKAFLVRVADHIGPDWAQTLYHTAVFITKVA